MSEDWGGAWTDVKLSVLRDYLNRFQTALKNKAYFRKLYIDALAGEGVQVIAREGLLLSPEETAASDEIRIGSALIALKTDPQFDRYQLNERSISKAQRLRSSANQLGVDVAKLEISTDDANDFIRRIVTQMGASDRGVVLLDPWGMQINWTTVQLIAKSQRLDMWYLFPTQAVVRMLPRDGMPSQAWSQKLDAILGDENWRSEFYRVSNIPDLFDVSRESLSRQVSFDAVERYIVGRLLSTFQGSCVEQPLRVGRPGNPMFSFCFASGNPSVGAKRLTKTLANAVIKANKTRA